MRKQVIVAVSLIAALNGVMLGQPQRAQRLNPVIDLLERKQPVFGLYAPSAGGNRGRGGAAAGTAPPATPAPVKQAIDLAKEALAYESADYLFNGSMERGVDRGL